MTRRTAYEHHGMTHSGEYSSWQNMLARCYNVKNPYYSHYGGRGITVCESWRNSFNDFISDMGLKPTNLHSIDRIDNNLGYCKNNCRWATRVVQIANRRRDDIKGYYFNNLKKRWIVDLRINKNRTLRHFKSEKEAKEFSDKLTGKQGVQNERN